MQRHLHDISPLSTSYEMGLKRVLLSANESGCSITQIAVLELKAGERSAQHIHPDLQDAFFILDGEIDITIDGQVHHCQQEDFVFVEHLKSYELHAITDVRMLAMGCVIEAQRTKLYPILFEPNLRPMVWGGKRLTRWKQLPEQDNIWESYLIIMRRLQTIVNVPFGKINHLGVAEHDASMSNIVREALVNFCQHADFFSPLRSSIHVFLNRIEFLNAGSFPVALNKMVGKFFSMARNPGISKMFRWADLCENEGFGMDELLSWQKITNSKVEIESEREFSRVILYLPENGANLGANEVEVTQDGANLGANKAQAASDGANLGANKQRILHAIQIDNTLSVLKLQVLTNIPLRTLQREINELIALGVLEKGGTRKNIIWSIKNM